MALKFAGFVLGAGLAFAVPLDALAAAPTECSEADLVGVPEAHGLSYSSYGESQEDVDKTFAYVMEWASQSGGLRGAVTGTEIYYPFDTAEAFDFALKIVVGIDGRVRCMNLAPQYGQNAVPQWNPQRRAWANSVSLWRFMPYLIDGVPHAATGTVHVSEYEDPETYVPMPSGVPKDVVIVHEMRPFGYRVELHGDGRAVYSSDSPYYFLGPQAYHVDPESVAYFLEQAEEADFWSLRDVYPKHPKNPGNYDSRIEITLGGVTKSLTDYNEPHSGMPIGAHSMPWGVRHWIDLGLSSDLKGIAQLKANGFDFTSKAAGLYLLQITSYSGVSDETVEAVMALGAPQDAYAETGWEEGPRDLLMAALRGGRSEIAHRLIAEGGLKTDGEIDQAKVDRAFISAVESGDVPSVDLIVPFHPAMTYPDPENTGVQISVLFKLRYNDVFDDEARAMIQRLLELGADVNARAADGDTLLHRISGDEGTLALEYLLDHGADVNAVNNDGETPLVSQLFEEDRALLLLERGADPRIGKTPETLRENIDSWPRVKTWLLTHGYADVLTEPKPGK